MSQSRSDLTSEKTLEILDHAAKTYQAAADKADNPEPARKLYAGFAYDAKLSAAAIRECEARRLWDEETLHEQNPDHGIRHRLERCSFDYDKLRRERA